MAVTTYCINSDVEDVMSTHGVTAYIDDDESGSRSGAETAYLTSAVERAAAMWVNPRVLMRYKASDLSGNGYLKWANAVIGALEVCRRRNNPIPISLASDAERIELQLQQIQRGQLNVPEQAESFEQIPVVTNYDVERWHQATPTRVQIEESTGSSPEGNRKRYLARPIPWLN